MVVSQVMTAATVTVAQAAVGPIPGQPLTPPAVLPLFLGVPLALMALAVLAPWPDRAADYRGCGCVAV